jgi:dCMP deaminase
MTEALQQVTMFANVADSLDGGAIGIVRSRRQQSQVLVTDHQISPTMPLVIKSKPMEKWDLRFCELAKFVSEWSKDPNAKVGAVVFAKRGGDIAIGYNGFPMGVEDSAERLDDQEVKLELVVHAEQNALIAAGSRTQGSTVYVWGKPICARCAGAIIQAGVKRVVALTPEDGDPNSKWVRSGKFAAKMFEEAGIETDFYVVEGEA